MGELKARARWISEHLYNKDTYSGTFDGRKIAVFALTHLAQNRQAKRVRRDHFRFATRELIALQSELRIPVRLSADTHFKVPGLTLWSQSRHFVDERTQRP